MAVVKISELPAMQTIAGSDILPIVDTSETETKKVTKDMLLTDIDANEVQIDQLTEATQINDEDLLIITQNGVNKKISKANAKFASGDEIFVGDTLPSGEDADSIKFWLTDDDALEGEGNYISNEYGTSQEIGYSQEYLNGKVLWTNQSPTSAFTSNSINLATNNCDFFEVIYATNLLETNEIASTGKIPFGKRIRMFYGYTSMSGIGIGQRVIATSSNTTLTLENGNTQVAGSSISTNNNICVPLYVIGYKSEILN